MRKTIKKIGKCFIALDQKDERIIGQSILIVDNDYSWLGYLNSAIQIIRSYFPKAEISVLTFPKRKNELEKDFPALNFILPSPELRLKKYGLAWQIFKMRREKYDFITLFSLDITPIIVSLVFFKAKVVLYNRWEQWWSLRMRGFTEFFKITYIKKKARFSFKDFLKKIGLFFVLLERKDEKLLKYSVLLIDNGRAEPEHASFAILKIKKFLPYSKISMLTLEDRKELFNKDFPDLEIIFAGNWIIKRYRITRHMFRLRRNKYNYIILLSLDIAPIIISILFMNSKVLLYNQWHQWWSFNPISICGYLIAIPKFIFKCITNIAVFVYLLISVFWIFSKMSFNFLRSTLFRKRA